MAAVEIVLADAAENLFPARMQMAVSLGWHIVFSCLGRRVPGDRRVHRVARPQARQPGPARPGAHLGQGDGRALRGGRGLGHAALLRDGHPVARPDGAVRRGVRVPVRAGGLRLLHRGDLRRDLPVRLGPDVAAGAHAERHADDRLRDGGRVLRDRGERLDEQPDRLRPGRRRAGDRTPIRSVPCSARRPGRSSSHMYLAAYMVTGFAVASVYAVAMLRGPPGPLPPVRAADPAHRGRDRLADPDRRRRLDRQHRGREPAGRSWPRWRGCSRRAPRSRCRWAASTTTTSCTTPSRSRGGCRCWSPTTRTARSSGLESVPPDLRPPVNVVHLAYNVMVGARLGAPAARAVAGLALVATTAACPASPWFLRAVAVSGSPAAVVAMEAGWITTEVGRQPFIVYGVLRTADAVSPAPGLFLGFYAVLAIYVGADRAHRVRAAPARATRTHPGAARRRRPSGPSARREGGRAPMTLAEVVLGVMFVGLIAYGLFGGADFGAGIWDLLAGGTQRGQRQRDLIEHSIGPVWEANHVWLIFVLVVLWTAFSGALRRGGHHALHPADPGRLRHDRARGRVRVPQEHHHAARCAASSAPRSRCPR